MLEEGGVVDQGDLTGVDGERLPQVRVSVVVVRAVVDGGVVRASKLSHPAPEGAGGRKAALRAPVAGVVEVVAPEVGPERRAEVGVAVVVALRVEARVAAPALRHSVVDEVLEEGGVVDQGDSPDLLSKGIPEVRIAIEVILGIVYCGEADSVNRSGPAGHLGTAGSNAALRLSAPYVVLVIAHKIESEGGAKV